jgi:hypothetical protein
MLEDVLRDNPVRCARDDCAVKYKNRDLNADEWLAVTWRRMCGIQEGWKYLKGMSYATSHSLPSSFILSDRSLATSRPLL